MSKDKRYTEEFKRKTRMVSGFHSIPWTGMDNVLVGWGQSNKSLYSYILKGYC